jgi:hypothetical protein
MACAELGSPLYAGLLARAADDLDAGGATATVLRGYEDSPPGAAIALRLAGAVHRLVLARQAPDLALHYPSVGGTYEPGDAVTDEAVWLAFQAVLVDRESEVRETLQWAPQTNEPGRSLPLIGALAVVSVLSEGLPVRLVEIGASAGLNLRAEALTPLLSTADRDALPRGRPYVVTDRVGCDLNPLDPLTPEGRLTLSAYVWPDDRVRFERLRQALDIAAHVPAVVRRTDAATLLAGVRPVEGQTTVLWHSVMWQYLDEDAKRAVLRERDRLEKTATATMPFAHVSFEPADDPEQPFVVRLRWSNGGGVMDVELGTAPPHGVPVRWADQVRAPSGA